ncbi:MAG: transporter [Rhizobium sp.]|nr:transporter [Rhizobium sp.]
MKLSMTTSFLAIAAALVGTAVQAREPGTPTAMPTGATIGVPVGANPPPGLYYSNRNDFLFADVYSGDTKTPIEVDVRASAQQFHWVPGNTIFGGSYRAMFTVPVIWADQSAFGTETDEFGVGDIVVSPFNLSWMIAPGLFVQSGVTLTMPTGKFSTAPGAVNLGSNAFTGAVDVGVSYLANGWNLSAHANYFVHTKNPDTDYRSGDELIVNWTAMKDVGGFSIGPVGYLRQQVTDDRNEGSFYGRGISGKARQFGIGLGLTKNFGPVEANISYVHDFEVENTLGGDRVLVNFTVPLQF